YGPWPLAGWRPGSRFARGFMADWTEPCIIACSPGVLPGAALGQGGPIPEKELDHAVTGFGSRIEGFVVAQHHRGRPGSHHRPAGKGESLADPRLLHPLAADGLPG